SLDLSDAVDATIADGAGTGTITDDDAAPTVSLSATSYEVDEDAGTLDIIVGLSTASGQAVTVDFATADDTATDGADYSGASGTVTFAPGDVSETITIPLLDDSLAEDDEALSIELANPVNTSITGTNPATIVIADDGDADP